MQTLAPMLQPDFLAVFASQARPFWWQLASRIFSGSRAAPEPVAQLADDPLDRTLSGAAAH